MAAKDLGTLPLSLIASLSVAVALLGVRVFVMQRIQSARQRENRQETERLRSLATAYRSLAGSFSPAEGGDRGQLEEALADIILFGSLRQVDLAARAANNLVAGSAVDYQALAKDLRDDLRIQLGLEPIPATISLPPSGPSSSPRTGRGEGEGSGGRGAAGGGSGGGGAGGMGGMAAGAGGLGAGVVAHEATDSDSGAPGANS